MSAEVVDDYVRARWNDLVRTLLALGADAIEAELTAQDALVRCWSSWPEEHRAGDVDLLVYGELLRLWAARSSDPAVGAAEIARVLVGGAGLDAGQAEDLTGAPAAASRLWSGEHWDDRYSAPAPLTAIREAVRRARRRRSGAAAGVLAAVVIVGSAVVLGTGGDAPVPAPDPPGASNAIPLAWWGDDVLHLARVEVDTPGLRVLAQAGTDPTYAVVYGDSAGQVVQVDADGTSKRIGTTEPDAPVLGSAGGLVVWIDRTAGDPSLVVWDTAEVATVASLALTGARAGPDARLVAFDGDDVYLSTADGATQVWRRGASDTSTPDGASPFAIASSPLRAVSPTGRYVAAWDPASSGGPGVTVRSTSSDGADPPPLDVPGTRVLSVRFVGDDQLVVVTTRTYLLGRDYNDGVTQSGRFPVADLVTCDVPTGACAVAQLRVQDVDPSATESAVILAR